jgi:hypothetical protein
VVAEVVEIRQGGERQDVVMEILLAVTARIATSPLKLISRQSMAKLQRIYPSMTLW